MSLRPKQGKADELASPSPESASGFNFRPSSLQASRICPTFPVEISLFDLLVRGGGIQEPQNISGGWGKWGVEVLWGGCEGVPEMRKSVNAPSSVFPEKEMPYPNNMSYIR